ncbi:hypothetical protein BJV77DRAFT_742412 [Russula vinacea]|nr:hypothetical protein BJV77DRAFT_742412 [Russula vinacea]
MQALASQHGRPFFAALLSTGDSHNGPWLAALRLVRIIYNLFSIPSLISPVLAVQHVQDGGLHTRRLVGALVYLPCARAPPTIRYPYPRVALLIAVLTLAKGDIIRIAPNELHFSRPTVYNEIYNSQNKWDKDREYYRAFDLDESFFTQTDYLKSKHSRALISNLFSRRAISEIQHLIRAQYARSIL